MMESVQFFAVLLMLMLTLTLVLPVPRRVIKDELLGRTRDLLAAGTTMICLHFLFQFIFQIREYYGMAPGVMTNLLFFVPASWHFNLAILNLQRLGHVKRIERFVGLYTWILIIALLTVAHIIAGEPILSDAPAMRVIVAICSVIFAAMQFYYYYKEWMELRRIRRSLNNFFDYDVTEMLTWMEVGVVSLVIIAVLLPVVIFGSIWVSAIYALIFFACIYFFVISFVCYVVSKDAHRVMEMDKIVKENDEEQPDVDATDTLSVEEHNRIDAIVNRWIEAGNHLRSGITIQIAADEMKIPRYQFSAWLKNTEQELFSPWLTYLRVEEAKRQMLAHPDWSNDNIAERCGFGSRSYFQTVFRKNTGMTPMEFVEEYGWKEKKS